MKCTCTLPLISLAAILLAATTSLGQSSARLHLVMPTRMVNDKTLTLKAELLDAVGNIDWRTWTAFGTVSATRVADESPVPISITFFDDHAGIPPADSLRFYNGIGSVSITLDNGPCEPPGDIEVTVTVLGAAASRVVTVLDSPAERIVSGSLSGGDLIWGPQDGIIRVAGNISLGGSNILTIAPGTLVMLDADVDFEISSSAGISAIGTADDPIFFFPTMGSDGLVLPNVCVLCDGGTRENRHAWGQMRHTGSANSTFKHVIMTGGGQGSPEGHTRPPMLRFVGSSSFVVEDCVLVDNPGKAIYGAGNGSYTTNRTLISRCGHGTEYTGSGAFTLRISNSWYTSVGRGPGTVSCELGSFDCGMDGDLINPRGPNGDMVIDGCILTDGGDEVLDNSTGTLTVRNCIMYNVRDTGYTDDGGNAQLFMDNCLIFGNGRALSGSYKEVRNCTLFGGGCVGACCGSTVENSIIWPQSCNGCPATFNHSLFGGGDSATCGTANLTGDPLFVNSAGPQYDFNLQPGSPAINAGPNGERIGWLGFPFADACSVDGDCDDGNSCTSDACLGSVCDFAPINGCVACTVDADCSGDGACSGTCSAGLCNFPNTACDDGLTCTIGDACMDGLCVGRDTCPQGQACNPTSNQCEIVPVTLIFQQGVNGYTGTQDTQLVQFFPDSTYGDADCTAAECVPGDNDTAPEIVEWDSQESTHPPGEGMIVGLMRFDDIVGPGNDQIPADVQITSATLTYSILFNGGDEGEVHEVLVDWDEQSTWNNFGALPGPQPEDYGPTVAVAPGFQGGIGGAAVSLNVTQSVQRWVDDPSTNKGWILLPLGDNGSELQSSEYEGDLTTRPKLTVIYGGGAPTGAFPNVLRDPYLQMGSPTSMTIMWLTDSPGNSRVVYGLTPSNLDQTATHPASTTHHIVTITGLAPDTTYYYAVGSTEVLYAGGCGQHYFKTSPPVGSPTPFTSWIIGDSGGFTPMQFSVRNAMLDATGADPPELCLHMGDIAYQNATETDFTLKHFAAYRDVLAHTVFWPTFGNHEGYSSDSGSQSGPYYTAFTLPAAGESGGVPSTTEAYYSFDYANAHFVCLDSEDSNLSPGSAMLTWLQNDLDATTQQWLIAFWHHAPYSKGSHDSDNAADSGGRMHDMRENVLPILEEQGVDLVLSGHTHAYERSYLVDSTYAYGSPPDHATPRFGTLLANGNIIDADNGNPSNGGYTKTPGLNPHEGTVYAVIGHGGRSIDPVVGVHPVMSSVDTQFGSCLLTIDGNTLTMRNIRDTGAQTDVFSIVKACSPGSTECDDGRFCNGIETCDGSSTCQPGTSPCGRSQVCDERNDVCTDNIECTTDSECDDSNDCTQNVCQDNVCLFPNFPAGMACGDSSDTVCDNPDTCDANGTCQPHYEPHGTLCRSSIGQCDATEVCTGYSPDCPIDAFAPPGTECRPSAHACDIAEFCSGTSSACPDDAEAPDGTLCNDDGNICTDDVCTDGSCTHPHNSAPCDDGSACTTADMCSAGACLGGPPPDCDDGNLCTSDSCDSAVGCVSVDNTTVCDDGNACTENDMCSAGSCSGTTLSCDDGNACTTDSCDSRLGCVTVNNSLACDDGNACTENDVCFDGACAGSAVDCNDANECTDDSCDPVLGCTTTHNTATCNDNNACTENDVCSAGSCSGTALICDDGNVCTTDSCDSLLGCVTVNNSDPCDDGSACTDNDACSKGMCVGSVVDCNDNNACTDDSCDVVIGCQTIDNTAPCDDGDACTVNDVCSAGSCTGTTLTCDDGNACTDDACASATGCTHVNNSSPCDDANACTENDMCSAGACSGFAVECNDDNPCTDDSCDSIRGCAYANNTSSCDDGDACTSDACIDGTCASSAINCDDGNDCTDDSCDTEIGCLHTNNSSPCDDANACTHDDLCSDGVCSGTVINCSDDDPCTDDDCTEEAGCVHTDNTAACDDGNNCTIADTCTAGTCAGTAVDCSDMGDECNVASCDPGGTIGNCAVLKPTNEGGGCDMNGTCQRGTCIERATCTHFNSCADDDGDGIRDDACMWWSCVDGGCTPTPVGFADMGGEFGDCPPDGAADGNDRFHALNCFSNTDPGMPPPTSYPCESAAPAALNVDAGGQFGSCIPDGVCDGNDAFAALNAFAGASTCMCPLDGSPMPDVTPHVDVVDVTSVTLAAAADVIQAGELIDVDVILDRGVIDLRGYQLHLHVTGGTRGHLTLVDISINDEQDPVFSGLGPWQAMNLQTAQVVVGLDGPGIRTTPAAYLATYTYRASRDARGHFVIEVLHGHGLEERTFLFATPANGKVGIASSSRAAIVIDELLPRSGRRANMR